MLAEPFVSIIVCVRNGLPYLQEAIDSLLALDYTNYEVVIQDGASTDGTLAYLQSFVDRPNWSIASARDSGIGQGFNRALQRCRGEIVCSLDADNRFHSNALSLAVEGFGAHPDAAVVYGTCRMIDANGECVHTWVPPRFDVLGLIDGAVVPPFATSFFHRERCGDELRFDESMVTVADFDLWLRLSARSIVALRSEEPLVDVRTGEMSSTWRPETYQRSCVLKVESLRRYLGGPAAALLVESWFERCAAGLYLWGVDSLANIGASADEINSYFQKARAADLRTDRFRQIVVRARPVIGADDEAFADRVFDQGAEEARAGRYDQALPLFDLLVRSGLGRPEATAMLEECRSRCTEARLAELREEADRLQEEVDTRDALLARLEADCRQEVERRDQLLRSTMEALQQEVDTRDRLLAESRDRYERSLSGRTRAVVERVRRVVGRAVGR